MSRGWPLIGRDHELQLIASAIGRRDGHAGVVVGGDAGVGKTRLVREALATSDLAVQRMPNADHTAVPAIRHADQAAPLGVFHNRRIDQSAKNTGLDWFCDRNQVNDLEHGIRDRTDLCFDQPDQRRRHHRCARPYPLPVANRQAPSTKLLVDQMPQIEHISVSELPHPACAVQIDRAVESAAEQLVRVITGERLQVQQSHVSVFPQRGHGVGNRFPAADADDHRRVRRVARNIEHGSRSHPHRHPFSAPHTMRALTRGTAGST